MDQCETLFNYFLFVQRQYPSHNKDIKRKAPNKQEGKSLEFGEYYS